jgi:hypothetical protein
MGWQPQVDKEEGVRRLCDWVRAHAAMFTALESGSRSAAVETG